MDNIQKFLLKLSKRELSVILDVLEKIKDNNIKWLDTKRLKDTPWWSRIRKAKIRIIYYIENNKGKIISIDYRGSAYDKLER